MTSPIPLRAATLYMKAGCHLCDDARADLDRLRARYPHQLRLVDISADAELVQRYGVQIPVLAVGGKEYAAPLPHAVLERALRDAEAADGTDAADPADGIDAADAEHKQPTGAADM
jgi:hypothetical protein